MWMWGRSFVDEETDEGRFDFAPEPEPAPECEFGFGKKKKNVGRAC